MKTTVIELYGAPRAGKKIVAARLLDALHVAGANVLQARNHPKMMAVLGLPIDDPWGLLDMAFHQIQDETILYGQSPVVITDNPLQMFEFYAQHLAFDDVADYLRLMRERHPFWREPKRKKVFVPLCHPGPGPCFESALECKEINEDLWTWKETAFDQRLSILDDQDYFEMVARKLIA